MSAYVKNGDQLIICLSKAEANALLGVVQQGLALREQSPRNGMTVEAERKAIRALETVCQPGSRMGASF